MALRDLFRTKLAPLGKLATLFSSSRSKGEILAELEELLLLADIARPQVEHLVSAIAKKTGGQTGREEYLSLLRQELLAVLPGGQPSPLAANGRTVLLLVGVNGSGKTTSAAKLAGLYKSRGLKVLLAAADTFRAAGSSQLSLWGERLGIPVVSGDRGADPGSVVFNAMRSWQERGFDLLIVDTAGRVQSKENLMRELEKITRVIAKLAPGQPAATWLVLDASTGQNALVQADKFREFSGINGLFLAKLDGTAKGGAVVSIAAQMGIPVLFVGHGEAEGDLWEFAPGPFVDSLLET
jgi:fused signal recognition particle receptor